MFALLLRFVLELRILVQTVVNNQANTIIALFFYALAYGPTKVSMTLRTFIDY